MASKSTQVMQVMDNPTRKDTARGDTARGDTARGDTARGDTRNNEGSTAHGVEVERLDRGHRRIKPSLKVTKNRDVDAERVERLTMCSSPSGEVMKTIL